MLKMYLENECTSGLEPHGEDIMKQLLLGNEAVARGLYEAGVRVFQLSRYTQY